MESKKNKQLIIGIAIYAVLFLLLLLISNLEVVNTWLSGLFYLFRPVLIGLAIAYLCNPFFRFFERKLFAKIRPNSLRRGISLFFTYLVLLLIIAVLLMLILPQLIDSIASFLSKFEDNLLHMIEDINELIVSLNQKFFSDKEEAIPLIEPDRLMESISGFLKSIRLDVSTLLTLLNPDIFTSIFDAANVVLVVFTDIILAFFVSLYMLNTKEKRYAQIMRMRSALLSDRTNDIITRICTTADKSFGGFIKGKMLDSCMVGILVYILISILNVPYAILIAVIVGITDFVPVIGPFIGVIPSAVIILLTDPTKVIPFLLCILIVQQIDGNILAPKILGENTGVSSLCVMIAITTMGSLWGLVGMVLGVPLFATVLELTSSWLDNRLKQKGLPIDTESYYIQDPNEPPQEESNLLKRMQQKKARRLQQESVGGKGSLTPLERFQLDTFDLMQKYQISKKKSEDLPGDFIEEENALAESMIQQMKAEKAEQDDTDEDLADNMGNEENPSQT